MRNAWVLAAMVLLPACRPAVKCEGFLSSGAERASTFTAESCEDKVTYKVSCVPKLDGSGYACVCQAGGSAAGKFESSQPLPSVSPNADAALAIVNPSCGWKLLR